MIICVLLSYANPHTTGWIDELIRTSDDQVIVGIANSVRKYRDNHFEEADNKNGYLYFFKNENNRKEFYKYLQKCEYLITLGIFEPWFFKIIFYLSGIKRIFVLSEPLRSSSKKKVLMRKSYIQIIRIFKDLSHFSFLCMGGSFVKKQYMSLGFKNSKFYEFGHFPKLSLERKELTEIPVIKFVFVGRIIHRKGIDVLIKVIEYLKNKYQNWDLLIVGDGDLKNTLIRNCEGEKRIKYIENVNDPELMKIFFNEYHILLLPSYFDGWGAVVNEALSSCCSLLLSQYVYAGASLLKDKENGFYFDPYDFEGLCEIIDYYFDTPEILMEHFKKSEEIFMEWNQQNAAKSFYNLLHEKVNHQNVNLLKEI